LIYTNHKLRISIFNLGTKCSCGSNSAWQGALQITTRTVIPFLIMQLTASRQMSFRSKP